MFRNRKLFKDFISNIENRRYAAKDAREKLKELPIQVVRAIGKKIIYKNYDGYNFCRVNSEMAYFDNLDRWQKEFFIMQRLHKLYE